MLLITSVLVFGGLFMIGDPVEILVNPSADQIEKERATKALGLDKPLHEQYVGFLRGALTGNLGKFLCLRAAGTRGDLRTHAGNTRAGLPRDGDRGHAAFRSAFTPGC